MTIRLRTINALLRKVGLVLVVIVGIPGETQLRLERSSRYLNRVVIG